MVPNGGNPMTCNLQPDETYTIRNWEEYVYMSLGTEDKWDCIQLEKTSSLTALQIPEAVLKTIGGNNKRNCSLGGHCLSYCVTSSRSWVRNVWSSKYLSISRGWMNTIMKFPMLCNAHPDTVTTYEVLEVHMPYQCL